MPERLHSTSSSNEKDRSAANTCLYLLKEHAYEYQVASANQWLKGTVGDHGWKHAELPREKWAAWSEFSYNKEHCISNKL